MAAATLAVCVVVVGKTVAGQAPQRVESPAGLAGSSSAPRPLTESAARSSSSVEASNLDRTRARAVLVKRGVRMLEQRDPVRALEVFRQAAVLDATAADTLLGLARCHLLLGHAEVALRYARAVQDLLELPGQDVGLWKVDLWDAAVALEIRALMRGRQFRASLERSTAAVQRAHETRHQEPGLKTLAAHGSALFRTQNNSESARIYREVVRRDPLHAEAHLRLGSGLTDPVRLPAVPHPELVAGVEAVSRGDLALAVRRYRSVLAADPNHPVTHRLLGEVLLAQRDARSMAAQDDAFRWIAAVLPRPSLVGLPVDKFMPAFAELSSARRAIATRGLALFGRRVGRLVSIGGRHDLIVELERTTDHEARAELRGRKTFDGRVWDDVRGIGGLRAATGIEALDEAAGHGFDTLAHEIAHQAHLYAFPRKVRTEIRRLYREALRDGKCLDFYAASNDAEYFGQGVEAFVSLAKRPGFEVTHGHTRFELMRVDPELHALIAREVDLDPLDPKTVSSADRLKRLRAAIAAGMRSGRFADALTAASMLPADEESRALLAAARAGDTLSRSY